MSSHAEHRGGRGPVVAMVGAGQLARMTHRAAIDLGVRLRVLAESPQDAAVLAGAEHVIGSPQDPATLRALADGADVMTFDHEQIPPELLVELEAEGVPLAPAPAAKLMAQDKLHARRALAEMGYPVPPFAHASREEDVAEFSRAHGWPLFAKAPRGGYDGRGVQRVQTAKEAAELLAREPLGLVLEPALELEQELAVLVARSRGGQTAVYPVVETVQVDGMCREILAPAPVEPALARDASQLALSLAGDIGATGIMAVELFLTGGGLMVNELALRPHNSGHYTIEGCVTSQFEQHLRAVLDWPLGLSDLRSAAVATVNLIGPADGSDPAARVPAALAVPGAHPHLYGKTARPGRKLGHVTVCGDDARATQAAARQAADRLHGEGR